VLNSEGGGEKTWRKSGKKKRNGEKKERKSGKKKNGDASNHQFFTIILFCIKSIINHFSKRKKM